MKYKLACATLCYSPQRYNLDIVLERISKIGFKYVSLVSIPGFGEHIMPEKITKKELQELKRKIKDYGLTVLAIFGPHCLEERSGVDFFKKRMDLAKELGGEVVDTGTIWPYKRWPDLMRSKEELALAEKIFYENIDKVASYAESIDITVGLETHTGLTATGKKSLEVMKKINSKYIRITYDTANLIFYDGVRPEEDISYIAKYVAHMHVKDHLGGWKEANFPTIGEGDINFKHIFSVLKEVNFSGPFSIEGVHGETIEETDEKLKKSLKFLNQTFRSIYGD